MQASQAIRGSNNGGRSNFGVPVVLSTILRHTQLDQQVVNGVEAKRKKQRGTGQVIRQVGLKNRTAGEGTRGSARPDGKVPDLCTMYYVLFQPGRRAFRIIVYLLGDIAV